MFRLWSRTTMQLELWKQHCPENFENRAALVGAEIARIEGRALEAMNLYERAIRRHARTALLTTKRSPTSWRPAFTRRAASRRSRTST